MKFKPMPIIRFFARWFFVFLLVAMIFLCIAPLIFISYEEYGLEKYFYFVAFGFFTWLYIYGLHKETWEKIFATIYISEDVVIWKCLFRKTRRIETSKCYIGVEMEKSHNKLEYPYIYFSLKPYPFEMRHKIDKISCSDEFVKYRYDPDIAEYILKILPSKQTKQLDYYCCVQRRKKR